MVGTAALSVVAKWVAIGTTASALMVGGGVAVKHAARDQTDSAPVRAAPARTPDRAPLAHPSEMPRAQTPALPAQAPSPVAPAVTRTDGVLGRAASDSAEPMAEAPRSCRRSSASRRDETAIPSAERNRDDPSSSVDHSEAVESRMHQEARLVAEARMALRANAAARAAALLAELERDFPDGVLRQEREALAIETRTGQPRAARERGERFLAAYPGSLHATRVRALIGALEDR
jgi:hypothetical protein